MGPQLPELALGILSGRERAAVLEHVAQCPRCSTEMERLTPISDGLLALAPEMEPPVGFEVRLFDQLGLQHEDEPPAPTPAPAAPSRWRRPRAVRSTSRWRRSRAVLGAAAALVLVAGFGVGWVAAQSPAPAPSAVGSEYAGIHVAALWSGSTRHGRVVTYDSSPGWILMSVHGIADDGPVRCTVALTNGTTMTVGTFWLDRGQGSWASTLRVPVDRVQRASLVSARGVVLASAVLGAKSPRAQ
jgi:hypothetical protein